MCLWGHDKDLGYISSENQDTCSDFKGRIDLFFGYEIDFQIPLGKNCLTHWLWWFCNYRKSLLDEILYIFVQMLFCSAWLSKHQKLQPIMLQDCILSAGKRSHTSSKYQPNCQTKVGGNSPSVQTNVAQGSVQVRGGPQQNTRGWDPVPGLKIW